MQVNFGMFVHVSGCTCELTVDRNAQRWTEMKAETKVKLCACYENFEIRRDSDLCKYVHSNYYV